MKCNSDETCEGANLPYSNYMLNPSPSIVKMIPPRQVAYCELLLL